MELISFSLIIPSPLLLLQLTKPKYMMTSEVSRAAEGESLPPGIGNVAPEPALKKWAGLLSLCDLLLLMSPEVQKLFCDSC